MQKVEDKKKVADLHFRYVAFVRLCLLCYIVSEYLASPYKVIIAREGYTYI